MSMILLFNHTLTPAQILDAEVSLGVERFISLPAELKNIWGNVPPDLESLEGYLAPIRDFITACIDARYILIQGDFGATYAMVNVSKSLGLTPIYATTMRKTIEKEVDGKMLKESIFDHVMYRVYA